ncbi:hypothetical protein CPB84DRAFT_1765296 [Gymnopilus junonius]|uniref:Uncharacterized protein n=1 Tax=Gymnopilus junonius TaxID=109634 RepID=A0A9P5NX27_GYMJU|nr:hypothetical protein CPB84DRAFT_1765296 [Gymnopilus junonius]
MTDFILAHELLDLILDQIDANSPEGRTSLSACSRASHLLQSMCRLRIFRHVNISYESCDYDFKTKTVLVDDISTGAKFLDLITTTPLIASYSSDKEGFSLYAIVPRLMNLCKFAARLPIYANSWHSFEKRTQLFFLDITSRVQELDLQLFQEFPVSAFFGRNNLRSLRVSSLHWEPEDGTQSTATKVKLISLDVGCDSLSFQDTRPCFSSPWSPFDLSHLRSLRFSNHYFMDHEINELLALCSSTLESLSISVDVFDHYRPPTRSEFPTLSDLQQLRHLEFKVTINGQGYRQALLSHSANETNDISHIASILNTLSPPPDLQIDLLLKVINMPNFDIEFILLPWAELVEVLNGPRMAGHLKEVKFVIQRYERGRNRWNLTKVDDIAIPTLYQILDCNEGLKDLRQRGILTCAPADSISSTFNAFSSIPM